VEARAMTSVAAQRSGRFIGPTWTRDEAGRFILPDLTLGWHVIDWCEEWLLQPDGPDAGEQWRFTNEQKRFVLHWYSLDSRGRFIYRAGMLRRMKGHGKDPFLAALCCAEFIGPCRFAGFGADGEPLATENLAATVQIAAVSQDQVKRNTMNLFPQMLSSRAIREYDLDIGKEITYGLKGKVSISMLTTSARSAEGARSSFIVANETQHWLANNGGNDMAQVCARNVAKSRDGSARILAISNAHAPGEMSVAEADYESAMLGDAGLMYDSIEASDAVVEALRVLKFEKNPSADEARLRELLRAELEWTRGDSTWLDIDRLLDECLAPKTQMNEALRFYFNRLAASEERAFNVTRWNELAMPVVDGERWRPEKGATITLGFDGSKSDDWTVLIGTDVKTGTQWPVGIWEPRLQDDGEWHIDVAAVNAVLDDAMERWEVWRLNADPYWWGEQINAWAGRYNQPGHEVVVSYPTTNLKTMALAILAYRTAIDQGDVRNDGDERMAFGINNAHKSWLGFKDDNDEPMFKLTKALTSLKIDPAVGGVLSWDARSKAIAAGVLDDSAVEVWWINE
jgi:hypothetical protein